MYRHDVNTPTSSGRSRRRRTLAATAAMLALAGSTAVVQTAHADPPSNVPTTTTISSGIAGANGSTIGPDGALYVTESGTGSVLRIDPETGASTTFASGLPTNIAPIGGPMDLVFHRGTAYVLVSLVGEFFGSDDVTGIYRMDGPDSWTVIADLGAWALDHPPSSEIDYFIPTGVHYSIELFRGGFVVAEAHHNKVLHVTPKGHVTELRAFGNVVPTGLDTHGQDVLVALAGPQPHLPEDGRVVALSTNAGTTDEVAAGGPLLVDVERGRGQLVFALAQGHFTPGQEDGSPADPNTGSLLLADGNGGFVSVVGGLDRPTSVEIVGITAFVIGLGGDVTRIDDIASPPFARR